MTVARRGLRLAFALAGLTVNGARAEILKLECKHGATRYSLAYDTQTGAFQRQDGPTVQAYRVMRVQLDKGDALVWGVKGGNGGDVLAFFGAKTMVKYFYGNGSETTDACERN